MTDKRRQPKVSFEHFLEKFPEIDLPVTLTDEAIHTFSKVNDPLPVPMIEQFLQRFEEEPADELTEYVACFRIADTSEFHALVYWRAGLMNYQYILATFTKQGLPIDRKAIAGTYYDGRTFTRSVATIDDEWIIYVVAGQAPDGNDQSYDASSSRTINLELMPDGRIAHAE
ncbi:MAG: hypothetical protein KDC43_01190 [Saprospiraceae bacterium]|nr:hypothetical protein [Saprospiraceae bacterium]MCB0622553.1 hypothetical protein [Saprospiraceae bacterium]MCB0677419.1 hypothetical protein [Saprospiraceae bacterium]MCB0680001.1 hypothetical protein [Saprospiraceae bacterium]